MNKNPNCLYNGKRIKIIDTRAPVSDGQGSENVFIDKDYYLAIWDKSLKIDMGSAKQLPNGGYVGFIPHGMNELHILRIPLKLDTDSTANWTPIPRQTDHSNS
jgi:hypothetical protein